MPVSRATYARSGGLGDSFQIRYVPPLAGDLTSQANMARHAHAFKAALDALIVMTLAVRVEEAAIGV